MKEFCLKEGKIVGKLISMVIEKYKNKDDVTKEECLDYIRENIYSVISK